MDFIATYILDNNSRLMITFCRMITVIKIGSNLENVPI